VRRVSGEQGGFTCMPAAPVQFSSVQFRRMSVFRSQPMERTGSRPRTNHRTKKYA
jgi:hypothetical protein